MFPNKLISFTRLALPCQKCRRSAASAKEARLTTRLALPFPTQHRFYPPRGRALFARLQGLQPRQGLLQKEKMGRTARTGLGLTRRCSMIARLGYSSILTQLHTGHARLNGYLHRMSQSDAICANVAASAKRSRISCFVLHHGTSSVAQ